MMAKKWAAAAFLLWTAFVSIRHIHTIIETVRGPLNPGDDVEWLGIWLGFAGIVIAPAAMFKHALRIVFGALALIALLVFILSGTLAAAGIAGGLIVLAHLLGRRLLAAVGVTADELALTIPLGLVPIASAGFALGAVHRLRLSWIVAMLAGLAAVALYRYRRSSGEESLRWAVTESSEVRFPLLVIAPVIFLNLVWAVAPEIQFDAVNYHLAVPQIYLRNGGFIDQPYFFHSYSYRLTEMLFTIAMALNGAAAAKLLSFGFSLIASLAVFSLGRVVFDERVGAWAAAFFYTTPVVSRLSGTAYVDDAAAMFLAAATLAFLKWRHTATVDKRWLCGAVLAGATVAVKINAAFGLPVLSGIAVWRIRNRPRVLAGCALLALAVALPWYTLTFNWTGNPVFPLMNRFFRSPLWDSQTTLVAASSYGIGTSPGAFIRLPFRLTWNTDRFGEGTPRGAAGPILLLALPFSFSLVLARKKDAGILFAIAVVQFSLWAISFQNVRFFVYGLPVLTVLAVATILHFSSNRPFAPIYRICLAVLLVMQFPATAPEYWEIPERFPVKTAFGGETRDAFLSRSLAAYGGAQFLNSVVHPGERIIGVDVENVRLYTDAPLETLPSSTLKTALRPATSMSGEELFRTLKQSRFAYIFCTRESLRNPLPAYSYLMPEFLKRFATRVFSDGHTVIYRLNR